MRGSQTALSGAAAGRVVASALPSGRAPASVGRRNRRQLAGSAYPGQHGTLAFAGMAHLSRLAGGRGCSLDRNPSLRTRDLRFEWRCARHGLCLGLCAIPLARGWDPEHAARIQWIRVQSCGRDSRSWLAGCSVRDRTRDGSALFGVMGRRVVRKGLLRLAVACLCLRELHLKSAGWGRPGLLGDPQPHVHGTPGPPGRGAAVCDARGTLPARWRALRLRGRATGSPETERMPLSRLWYWTPRG
jgi:hypothetical protein